MNAQRTRHKVYTTLEENSPVKPKPWKTGKDVPDKDSERSHRGWGKAHALQYALRQDLLACKEPKEFWDFVRKRTDPRPRPAKVSVSALSNDFETRLNHPRITPSSFNAEQLVFNVRMDKELKQAPLDVSPLQSYTRDITIEEIQAMKRHIKAHGLDTSMGVDGFSYKDCMAIPNEKLLEFFLYCLKNQDIPHYLECCMLKMLTLQNGFQDHLRTNDNVFVT
ncbi:hypothetical protein C8R43DRAFT_899289 [Mycena crocata]|nr:hypothetical protein C8R43DRAFT_899289 [Mycena crocata]